MIENAPILPKNAPSFSLTLACDSRYTIEHFSAYLA